MGILQSSSWIIYFITFYGIIEIGAALAMWLRKKIGFYIWIFLSSSAIINTAVISFVVDFAAIRRSFINGLTISAFWAVLYAILVFLAWKFRPYKDEHE